MQSGFRISRFTILIFAQTYAYWVQYSSLFFFNIYEYDANVGIRYETNFYDKDTYYMKQWSCKLSDQISRFSLLKKEKASYDQKNKKYQKII